MYKKVILDGDVAKTEDGRVLGRNAGGFPGRIFFEDENENMIGAVYGTTDENGRFHTFCTGTSCNKTCFHSDAPSCRYNRKYVANAGYYVNID